jgi:peptidoglycan/LPS O-acetylase OafA/YrhL
VDITKRSDRIIPALTGVRAVAVLLVFLAHLQQRYLPYQEFIGTPIANASYFGMTVFFVLSGFVIHWNYAPLFSKESPKIALWKFFVARFSRLWPLHFVVTILATVQWPDLSKFIQHLFMVQTWAYQGTANISYYNTWSISSEWFFYFVFAACYPVIARGIRVSTLRPLLWLMMISFGITYWLGPNQDEYGMWVRYFSPYVRVLEFVLGAAAAQYVMTKRHNGERELSDKDVLFVAILAALLYGLPFEARTNLNYFIAPLVAVLLIVASNPVSLSARALSPAWLLWIGERSYSIYLLEAVYLVQNYRIETPLGYSMKPVHAFSWSDSQEGLVWSLFSIVLVFAAADVCWRYFEMPARKWIKTKAA